MNGLYMMPENPYYILEANRKGIAASTDPRKTNTRQYLLRHLNVRREAAVGPPAIARPTDCQRYGSRRLMAAEFAIP